MELFGLSGKNHSLSCPNGDSVAAGDEDHLYVVPDTNLMLLAVLRAKNPLSSTPPLSARAIFSIRFPYHVNQLS